MHRTGISAIAARCWQRSPSETSIDSGKHSTIRPATVARPTALRHASTAPIDYALKHKERYRLLFSRVCLRGLDRGPSTRRSCGAAKYGGMELSEMQRLKQVEDENRRLKQIVAEQTLDIQALKAVVAKKW